MDKTTSSHTIFILTSDTSLTSGVATSTDKHGEKLDNYWIGLEQSLILFQDKG